MNDSRWFTYAALALMSTVLIGIAVGAGIGGASGSASPPNASSAPGPSADYVNLTIAWNPTSGLDEYFPANFTVPVHTLVIITITSYDNGTNVVPSEFTQVAGTTGGVETVTRGSTSQVVSSVNASGIAHTFTMMSTGGPVGSGPALNVVVPAAVSVHQPVAVEFSTYFNETGAFVWNCMAPCDMSAMMTPGLMTGTVAVV